MKPIIFHIDVNSAYLSWTSLEKLKNGSETDLRTIPSIIGGDEVTITSGSRSVTMSRDSLTLIDDSTASTTEETK